MKILSAGEAYTGQMNRYPVLNLTLKSAKQGDFETAVYMTRSGVTVEFGRYRHFVERGRDQIPEDRLLRDLVFPEGL